MSNDEREGWGALETSMMTNCERRIGSAPQRRLAGSPNQPADLGKRPQAASRNVRLPRSKRSLSCQVLGRSCHGNIAVTAGHEMTELPSLELQDPDISRWKDGCTGVDWVHAFDSRGPGQNLMVQALNLEPGARRFGSDASRAGEAFAARADHL